MNAGLRVALEQRMAVRWHTELGLPATVPDQEALMFELASLLAASPEKDTLKADPSLAVLLTVNVSDRTAVELLMAELPYNSIFPLLFSSKLQPLTVHALLVSDRPVVVTVPLIAVMPEPLTERVRVTVFPACTLLFPDSDASAAMAVCGQTEATIRTAAIRANNFFNACMVITSCQESASLIATAISVRLNIPSPFMSAAFA